MTVNPPNVDPSNVNPDNLASPPPPQHRAPGPPTAAMQDTVADDHAVEDRNPNPPPPAPLISPNATVIVNGVSKSFGSLVAVSDVSFSVEPGVTALLGPNGAGKSTLLRILCGLTPPSTGSISVAGGNPRVDAAARAQIGLVPQQDGVFERDSLYDFVHLSAVLNGVVQAEQAVRWALNAVELDPDLDRPLGAFPRACGSGQRSPPPWSTTPRSWFSTSR